MITTKIKPKDSYTDSLLNLQRAMVLTEFVLSDHGLYDRYLQYLKHLSNDPKWAEFSLIIREEINTYDITDSEVYQASNEVFKVPVFN
ncbi:hypothetical protein LCM23_14535 [Cytobacillus kochii]|uniref:hypothetical protein n=1 Tax=Cytobacillus kochii TaxID=859143 RepID=UPI001CD1E082|nr:hypothetical protein [Cytobacillus kochii]MCA1027315.1 hypothetical protein [Cytobacillus kochii]